ncbi:MFS general substrate transporter [Wolfiporia cocos MD-104 SS10]|uniref:MFS general substrate transporter n=1 Tax=Wolfiporia cocos (strain MD-104) TaxID=742152 RepID=A0A2H3J8A4_WOLCO|nr:MFS general substrate transporter [Wolfiporia cocos MD-104 SS10]
MTTSQHDLEMCDIEQAVVVSPLAQEGPVADKITEEADGMAVEKEDRSGEQQEDALPPFPCAPAEFEEGGWRGWVTVAGAYSTSFGVYQAYYTQEYITNQTSSTISWIGSVNTFLVIGFGLVSGRLYDKGYFYYLTIGGSILYSFSLFMLSLAKPNNFYQVFLAQGLGMGLGAGTIYIPSVAVVSHYFRRKRALAMTIVASGSSLGAIIHPIMLNNTLFSSLGFGNSVRASAGLITGMLAIACCMMHARLPPPQSTLGFGRALRKFSRDGAYVCASVGLAIFTIGYYFPLFYIQLDATRHGLSTTFSFYSLVIMNSASFVGRLSPGFFAHRVGIANMICFATFCCTAMIFAFIGLGSVASVVVIGIIFGYFAGVYIALMGPLMTVLTEDLSELGMRMGIAFAFSGIGSLIGTPISGALLTGDYIWWRPAVFSGVVAAESGGEEGCWALAEALDGTIDMAFGRNRCC